MSASRRIQIRFPKTAGIILRGSKRRSYGETRLNRQRRNLSPHISGWTLNRLEIPLCLMVLFLGCERTAQSSAQASPAADIASPIPTPRCWIFDKVYPATEAAYESQRVTLTERKEIEKWAAPASPSQERLVRAYSPWTKPPSASEQHLVRWMRSPFERGDLFVFVARPIERPPNGYSPWVALNANVIIDTVQCSVHAYPTA